MGLDVSHGAYSGAYGSVARWRKALAEAAGYRVVDNDYVLDWNKFESKNYEGMWDSTPEDALLVLLVHSDSEGFIYPAQLESLIKRLEGLVPKLPNYGQGHHASLGIRGVTQRFIDGAKLALENDEPLEFY